MHQLDPFPIDFLDAFHRCATFVFDSFVFRANFFLSHCRASLIELVIVLSSTPRILCPSFDIINRYMSQLFLSVIIPTHNHARTLALVLLDIRHHLERLNVRHEIIIVDDHSRDGTLEVARRFSLFMKSMRVVSYQGPAGFLGAIRYGASFASGDYYFVFPPDGTVAFDEIEKMLPFVEQNRAQIVFGIKQPPWFYWFTRFFTRDRFLPRLLMRSDVAVAALSKLDANASFVPALQRLAKKLGYCYAETSIA